MTVCVFICMHECSTHPSIHVCTVRIFVINVFYYCKYICMSYTYMYACVHCVSDCTSCAFQPPHMLFEPDKKLSATTFAALTHGCIAHWRNVSQYVQWVWVCDFFNGLSLLITLHSTVWILGRMRVGSVVGMLQRSIRKLLIITVITAAHGAAIRERWVANKYAPNIHICSCCCFERWFMSVFI